MNTSHTFNPFRAVPIVFALILNVVIGPFGPALQSSLTGPQSALAYVGSAAFELDGNIDHTGSNHDWDQVKAGTSGADNTEFITDPVNTTSDDIFTGGGSKDQQLIQTGPWLWTTSKPQPKDDITHAFAAAYTINGHTIAYFGLDKYEVDGDNQVGFWFFKNGVGKTNTASQGGFKFSGEHAVGDILVLADYTNGGTVPNLKVYKWVGSGGSDGSVDLITSANDAVCNDSTAQFVCGITNSTAFTSSAWSYQNRDAAAGTWPAGALFEGGLDLTHYGLDTGCFSTFMAETRSSQAITATLSDFALGDFSFCETPGLSTTATPGSIDMGDSVTDVANLTGSKGPVEGSIDFFVCGPNASATACTSGGTKVGATETISSNAATSDPFTPTQPGWYCFRAEYAPAEGSKYLATSHTNATTECFQAMPAVIHVTKTADAASVSAGAQIGFTVTISNSGSGAAKGVTFDDALPGGTGIDWSIASSDAGWSVSGSAPNQSLAYGGTTLAAGASTSVHVVSGTTKDSCEKYDNTASVSTTNDGSDSASASTTVLCPEIQVTKTADAPSVTAGDPIGFTVTVTNAGQGEATGLSFSDPLPGGAGIDWSIDSADSGWSVSGAAPNQSLVYSPTTLAAGAHATVHVVSDTTQDSCKTYDNTAQASAANDGSDEASASTEVLCFPNVGVEKTGNGPVTAGDTATFTIVVTANGIGPSQNVHLDDTLPSGTWTLGGADAEACQLSGSTLSCDFGAMESGTSKTITLSRLTASGDCPAITNTATVSSDVDTNSGDNSSTATIGVNCGDIEVTKTPDVPSDDGGTVFANHDATFAIVVHNKGDGEARGVEVSDQLPKVSGSWAVDNEDCAVSGSGLLTCSLGDMAPGATITIHLSTTVTRDDCGTLANPVVNVTTTNDGSARDAGSILVVCPQLTIDKAADPKTVSVDPGKDTTVTWTLTWHLTDGPVTQATITDPIPAGLVYVPGSASDGGVYDPGTRTITWMLADPLSALTGTVTFKTTVASNIGGGITLTNVATIDSRETDQETGTDAIKTIESPPPQAATPTPSVPNTALVLGPQGEPIQVPVELLVLFFLGSLGTLTFVNVRAVRRRR